MSAAPFETGPLLVSDLPPVSLVPSALDGLLGRFRAARDRRAFERAVRFADPNEHADLLAISRRG